MELNKDVCYFTTQKVMGLDKIPHLPIKQDVDADVANLDGCSSGDLGYGLGKFYMMGG